MMTAAHIRQKLQAGQTTVGSWLQLPSPDTAEIMAHMGYDWLVIDMEHGSIDIRDLPCLLRAIHSGGALYLQRQTAHAKPSAVMVQKKRSATIVLDEPTTAEFSTPRFFSPLPLVRVPKAETLVIRRALDAGAGGLIFPMMQSRDALDKAIDAALYPHAQKNYGVRGVGYARVNTYGKDFSQSRQESAQVLLVAQVEHVDALHTLDTLVQHERLDAIMIGPYDLSASMGIMGQFTHPLFLQAMQEIQNICRSHAMPMGSHVVTPSLEALQQAQLQGYTFLAYGLDAHFLWQGAVRPQC